MSFLSDVTGINVGGGQVSATPGGLIGGLFGGIPGAFIGNKVGNAVNGQGGNQFSAPAMDSASLNQVSNNENSLLKTPGEQSQRLLKGTDAANSIASNSNLEQENNALGGGGIPGMSKAISDQAAKNFETQKGKLQTQADLQGMQMANQNMNVAASNAIALYNAQTGVQSSINNYNLQANAARYGVISSLMSGAGSMAGAYAGYNSNQNMINAINGGNMNSPMFGQASNMAMPQMGSEYAPASYGNALGEFNLGE